MLNIDLAISFVPRCDFYKKKEDVKEGIFERNKEFAEKEPNWYKDH